MYQVSTQPTSTHFLRFRDGDDDIMAGDYDDENSDDVDGDYDDDGGGGEDGGGDGDEQSFCNLLIGMVLKLGKC